MLTSRRTFVSALVGASLARSQTKTARVDINPETLLGGIPTDFGGLGYEISSVSEPGLLSAANRAYVQFVRTLAPAGVIRIGGNTSDYATWSPQGPAVSAPKATVVHRQGIADLGTFLQATGWRLIWGFNLGRGTVEQAVDEAAAVAASAGDHLLAFEIGNEPDLFPGVHRPANYSYADYHAEYLRYKKAIREKLPNAPFAGPDVIVHTDWLEQFAAAEAADLKLLTHHYYAEGPPDNPAATIENLLKPNPILQGLLARLQGASRKSGLPYRICEANSCFGGGKPGVSDTMASALWVLDFMFTLSRFDAAGVNIETGVNHLGFLSYYTPIGVNPGKTFRALPIYYGMLAFRFAGRGQHLATNLDNAGLNLAAYATHNSQDGNWLTLINKEPAAEAHVHVSCPNASQASAIRLTAPSLTSKDGVLLAGSSAGSDGKWTPGKSEAVRVVAGEFEIALPAASAALIRLG